MNDLGDTDAGMGWEDTDPDLLDDLIAEHDGAMNDHYCFMGDDNPFKPIAKPTITITEETI